ncbi:DUF2273 domain-containing protein [Eggerthella sinensis]|uniref:DUF2273 domain-containing protein n=1 Tax=Eggerthella sinensis TaxID=242230 RepID=UPI00266D9D4D|nr:DUF2273 domain-containing protein [Eggerthella sinensis]
MTQSTMRIHANPMPTTPAKPKQQQKPQVQPQTQPKSEPKQADTPSDVIANAASETKRDKGVYASMKRAVSPYVEHHSHAVLYGILGFIAAALILIIGFWPTVLLAVFAAVGVIIGKYRDGDRKTREQMKHILDRIN